MKKAFFGKYGGRYAPETLIPALEETDNVFRKSKSSPEFKKQLKDELANFVGRQTPLYFAKNLSKQYKAKVYLKREDLCHTGAHKINNALGQTMLAMQMGKKHIIAETGAGQHGVATATAAAHFGLKCSIYMGSEDVKRQAPNVSRMRWLGAEVISVDTGSKTLKDAINEAFRYWIANVYDTHYIFGSVLGPYPFPEIVAYFQSVIGSEAKSQFRKAEKKDPDYVIACVGGGSNAMGIFSAFIKNEKVKLIGVEAGGTGNKTGEHAARFINPSKGVLHGSYSYMLQKDGQVMSTHSIAPGLDYPMIGPEHAMLFDNNRAVYDFVRDKEALKAFHNLCRNEGIIPALESSHAIAYLEKIKNKIKGKSVLVNLSGRGDKDMPIIQEYSQMGALK